MPNNKNKKRVLTDKENISKTPYRLRSRKKSNNNITKRYVNKRKRKINNDSNESLVFDDINQSQEITDDSPININVDQMTESQEMVNSQINDSQIQEMPLYQIEDNAQIPPTKPRKQIAPRRLTTINTYTPRTNNDKENYVKNTICQRTRKDMLSPPPNTQKNRTWLKVEQQIDDKKLYILHDDEVEQYVNTPKQKGQKRCSLWKAAHMYFTKNSNNTFNYSMYGHCYFCGHILNFNCTFNVRKHLSSHMAQFDGLDDDDPVKQALLDDDKMKHKLELYQKGEFNINKSINSKENEEIKIQKKYGDSKYKVCTINGIHKTLQNEFYTAQTNAIISGNMPINIVRNRHYQHLIFVRNT